MKKLTAALVGAGNRGCIYADYSILQPDELAVVAVVEPNSIRRGEAAKRYGIKDVYAFETLDDFLEKKVRCDFVINATMDEIHYETSKKIMNAGYDMLLEKPIVAKEEQLLELISIEKERNVKTVVCHVLRYAPFYRTAKKLIDDGVIGDVMTLELNEHVWIAHFIDSFIRGKWNKESKCGSGFLLAKSCHDMDLICWLNDKAKPRYVSSFGSRSRFILKNAPADATEFCADCPHSGDCLYSAQTIHLKLDQMPFQTWEGIDKPLNEITYAEKEQYLKTSDYGRCAYNSGGDINDRQAVTIEFDNGSLATFLMVGGTSKPDRYIHVVGTHGEIEGHCGDNKLVLRTFESSPEKFCRTEKVIDLSEEIFRYADNKYAEHAGGDYGIMYDAVRYFGSEEISVSISGIEQSADSHIVVYAAEKSNKERKIIKI